MFYNVAIKFNVTLPAGLMATALAPSVRISVSGGESTDSNSSEEKGLRIKSRQQPLPASNEGEGNVNLICTK